MKLLWRAAGAGTLFAFAVLLASATTIDTTPGWTGGGYIFAATAGPAYYGQVFTAPPDAASLNSFTFFISGSSPALSFRAEVAPWNSADFTSGDPLYVSELRTNAGFPPYNGTVENYGHVVFTTPGGLPVIANAQYVAFLSVDAGGASAAIGNNFDVDTYVGGYHLFGGPANGWYNANDTHDYAFSASFSSVVPEPSDTALLLLGLGFIGVVARCSRRPSRAE
jgi:hypothetical protein